MNKGEISGALRRLGLLYPLDFMRFFLQKATLSTKNRAFRQNYPNVALPPDYLMYESFNLDYQKYYEDGLDTARWLAGHFSRYKTLENLNILDWGCGPGRIIRHLPEVIGRDCSFYGTDYNPKSIAWCRDNIVNARFEINAIEPPSVFTSNFFDIIYGISILTHLSEPTHHAWLGELRRILKPGGLMLLTTHGDAFKHKLSRQELRAYEQNQLIVRGSAKEGHRVFTAFHPPAFMRDFFAKYIDIQEYIAGGPPLAGKYPEQDVWILQKV